MSKVLLVIQLLSNQWDLLASNIKTKTDSKIVYNYLIKHPSKINTDDFISILNNISEVYFKKMLKSMDLFYEFIDFSKVFTDLSINMKIRRITGSDSMKYIKLFIGLDKHSFNKTINLYESMQNDELKTQILDYIRMLIKKDASLVVILAKAEIDTEQIISFKELEDIVLKSNNVDAMHEFGQLFCKSQNKILSRAFEIKNMDSNMQSFLNTAADFKPELYAKLEMLKACERVHLIGDVDKEHETIIKIYDAIVDKYFNISDLKVKQEPSFKTRVPDIEIPIFKVNDGTFIDENVLNKFDQSYTRKEK